MACKTGASQDCRCAPGVLGRQTCDPGGAGWLPCVCSGDLDLYLTDEETRILTRSDSMTDDEALQYVVPEGPPPYVAIVGYSQAENDYDLFLEVSGC